MDQEIEQIISSYIREYTEMDIKGTVIPCPYWMNKMVAGKVILRGFANGKGEASDIRKELIERLDHLSNHSRFPLSPENLRRFAKRERIGIDCSGFVFRILDKLVQLRYRRCKVKTLNDIFSGGKDRTNVGTLTHPDNCIRVRTGYRLGDMIRLMGGRHIVIITDSGDTKITYAHSSSLQTEIQGVHISEIQVIDPKKGLEHQLWLEKTKKVENYGNKYFWPHMEDGVFRLKIFK